MKWLAVVLLLAGGLRFWKLADRPMHADEAILADRLGTLLETGRFEYIKTDFHGPAVAYLPVPVAWLNGAASYQKLTESIIRVVPAIFGLVLVLISFLIGRTVSMRAGMIAALFTAVSPGLVYFSRYYIPEMLLVCFSAGLFLCVFRYDYNPSLRLALLGGALAGLMYATKETAVLAFAAIACLRPASKPGHLLAAAGAALAVMIGFFGPTQLWNSLLALADYAHRGLNPSVHRHPWYYYVAVLAKSGDLVFILAAIPALLARNRTVTLLAIYSVTLTLLYSALPYKTPWCALGFLHGWVLLAAIGVAEIRQRWLPAIICVALLIRACTLSFPLASDPANPYVYAHTLPDVYLLRQRIASVARNDTPIQVFTTENLWPLPWYLRNYPNVRWWRSVPADAPRAPVILVSPAMEDAVARHIYELPPPGKRELYTNLFDKPLWLRPGVEIRGYAVLSLRREE